MRRSLTFAVLAALLVTTACETVKGAGRDMQTAGSAVTTEAQKAENEM